MLWVTTVVTAGALMLQHLRVVHQPCTHMKRSVSDAEMTLGMLATIIGDWSGLAPVVKRGWLCGGSVAVVRGKVLSGSVSEVEAGDD